MICVVHACVCVLLHVLYVVDIAETDCRNVDNVPMLASCSYVSHLVSMATVVLSKVSTTQI